MNRDKCAEDMISILPYIFKKFKKVYQGINIPKQEFELLFRIDKNEGNPVSYYSELMMLPKSNLTVASNKLVKKGLIERESSPTDRRVIILKTTDEGKRTIAIYKDQVRKAMLEKLSVYSDEDIKKIEILIHEFKEIFDQVTD